MRDELHEDQDAADAARQGGWRARAAARLSVWVGASLAILIVVGTGLWIYRLTQRDVSAVPVIHAALTPAKVQPDDPGGAVTAHQDITSYGAGAGGGGPLQIVFAPPPERPAEEDIAMGALQAPETPADAASGDAATAPVGGVGTGFAPAASPVAQPRPGDLNARMAAAQRAASEEELLAARAAASIVQIQLGAYPTREQTQAEWERVYKDNEDLLAGRALVMQSTISGGRRFFRLRAGPFNDRVEAQNVCRALQARGRDCLVAVNG